jgi:hypothetical protein
MKNQKLISRLSVVILIIGISVPVLAKVLLKGDYPITYAVLLVAIVISTTLALFSRREIGSKIILVLALLYAIAIPIQKYRYNRALEEAKMHLREESAHKNH